MNTLLQYPIRGARASEIAASAEGLIREGKLVPGGHLPAVRALAGALRVSPATVAAAYRALAARGLVSGRGRNGTSVLPRPPLRTPAAAPLPAGARNLADGNPDPTLLPPLKRALGRLDPRPRLYGGERNRADLLDLARKHLEEDGIPAAAIAIAGGALDGIERVLQAHLRPGDRVAVEDPGYTGVLDLVSALGLVPEPVTVDDLGPIPEALAAALKRGARALVVTPRAQNPTGAALDGRRALALRRVLDAHADLLLIEDDHAGPVAGAPIVTLARRRGERWAHVRSVSKSLGPDLRLAFLAGDAVTVARVEGRQTVGSGWVSHVLQGVVAQLLSDPRTTKRLAGAARTYAARREALIAALRAYGIEAHGRSGLNVWIPVPEEQAAVAALTSRGWAVRAGERYRLKSPPAIRVTASTLRPDDARRLAADVARALGSQPTTRTA